MGSRSVPVCGVPLQGLSVDPPLDLRTSRQAVAPVPTDGSPTKPWRNTQSIAKRRSTPRVAGPYPAFLGGGHGAVST
ncbi:hypothetical protein Q2443_27260, partial [Escherichia coli]|nr:hypothetical protein [Escherichia coli]